MSNTEKEVDKNQYNPFESEEASKNYANADFLYKQSADHAVNFFNPFEQGCNKVLDLGAGTGVSSEALLATGLQDLTLIDPSASMLDKAKARLGENAKYIQSSAENFGDHFDHNVDVVYALNCFHLFHNLEAIVNQLSKSLKTMGRFIFNVSMPSFYIPDLNTEEFISLKANLEFYKSLSEFTGDNPLVKNTVDLFNKILAGDTEKIFDKKKLIDILFSVGILFDDYKEYYIVSNADGQKVIWDLVAVCLIENDLKRKEFFETVKVPAKMVFRQAYFSFKFNHNLANNDSN